MEGNANRHQAFSNAGRVQTQRSVVPGQRKDDAWQLCTRTGLRSQELNSNGPEAVKTSREAANGILIFPRRF